MEELYDCHHTAVGFVVKGCADTYSGPLPSKALEVPETVVSINVSTAYPETLYVGNVTPMHASYLTDSPRFCFRHASPSLLQQHMRGTTKFSFELPAGDIGYVEHIVGRSAEDYGPTTQGITTCDVEGQFDQRGLKICLSGHLNLASKTDITLRSKHYRVRALIEWRVLRFLFDIYFTKAMYSRVIEETGSSRAQ